MHAGFFCLYLPDSPAVQELPHERVGICAIVLIAMSSRNMKKNREAMRDLQGAIKVGARIMFAGGIYGKIVKIKNDVIDVEINKSTVIQISRYSIQNVITD